jgi:hypothetical protein
MSKLKNILSTTKNRKAINNLRFFPPIQYPKAVMVINFNTFIAIKAMFRIKSLSDLN